MNRDTEIDLVFKALGDPTRRRILDIIKNNPGVSMNEISEQFEISRFGVRKHMLLLEEANLISFRWERPTKRFFLNAIPIQMISDRWIAEYSKDRAERLTQLKYDLEELHMSDTQENSFNQTQVYVVYIRCSPEKLWRALTESEFTQQYYLGCGVQSDFKPDTDIKYVHGASEVRVSGKVTEFEPHKKFAHTFFPHGPDGQPGPESLVTYEMETMGENIKLTVTHARITDEGLFKATADGWPMILNGLKSLLETGSGLKFG